MHECAVGVGMVKKVNETNNEELLQLGLKAARQGQKDGARVMFQQVLARDKRNERAMMGMAQVARNANERQTWLRRVLKVNPDNDQALAALKKLNYKRASNENRTLLLFGAVVLVLIALGIAVLVILNSLS
jgi:thioredoxin-like negative regulator of GroEL